MWFGEVLSGLEGTTFWLCMGISHAAAAPVVHFEFLLQSTDDPIILVTLATGKAREILQEFELPLQG